MSGNRRGATLLVVEDDIAYGEALTELLKGEGHSVHHVLDGQEAIDCVREMGERLDLVLCDLLLPRRSGFEVVKEIVELELHLPVLAMTGVYESTREIHVLRGLGVAGYLHKSTPFEQLLFRVNTLLFPHRENMRGHYRVAVSIPVTFKADGETYHGTTHNLSTSGLYVRTLQPVQDGARVELNMGLPTARQVLSAVGEVVHSASADEVLGSAYPAGFGTRFTSVSPLVKTALRNFVDAVRREEIDGHQLGGPEFEVVESEAETSQPEVDPEKILV